MTQFVVLATLEIVMRQGLAHHPAASDQPIHVVGIAPTLGDEMRQRRSKPDLQIARLAHPVAGHGDDTADQRLAGADERRDGRRRAHVLADDADVARQSIGRYFLAQQERNELSLASGRVVDRHRSNRQSLVGNGPDCSTSRRRRPRACPLRSQSCSAHAKDVQHHLRAEHDGLGAVTHQRIVATDAGFAFNAVEQQGIDGGRCTEGQFQMSRKGSSAEAHDAACGDAREQFFRRVAA